MLLSFRPGALSGPLDNEGKLTLARYRVKSGSDVWTGAPGEKNHREKGHCFLRCKATLMALLVRRIRTRVAASQERRFGCASVSPFYS